MSGPASIPTPSVLFVCTGNICRSPMAAAVFAVKAEACGLTARVDHAGISNEEAGNATDPRAIRALARRGYALEPRPARQIRPEDFDRHDLIVAMTTAHERALTSAAPPDAEPKIHLMMAFAEDGGPADVPDPWYGGSTDFDYALELIEAAVEGLITDIVHGRLAP